MGIKLTDNTCKQILNLLINASKQKAETKGGK